MPISASNASTAFYGLPKGWYCPHCRGEKNTNQDHCT
ncbi:rubredoxin [Massilia timonae]